MKSQFDVHGIPGRAKLTSDHVSTSAESVQAQAVRNSIEEELEECAEIHTTRHTIAGCRVDTLPGWQ